MLALRHLHRAVIGRCLCTEAAETYDVVVVGGGMVGMSLAAALGSNSMTKHLRVAVLDRARVKDALATEPLPDVPDARVSTVTESSINFFVSSGAWSRMLPHAREFGSMQVWDNLNRGTVRWEAADVGAERMGAVVENSIIQSACFRAASDNPNVTFLWPWQLQGLQLPPDSPKPGPRLPDDPQPISFDTLATLTLTPVPNRASPTPDSNSNSNSATPAYPQQEATTNSTRSPPPTPDSNSKTTAGSAAQGKTIKARLVVAADGARSATRQAAGLRTMKMPYSQRGVVATVATHMPRTVAWQRFLKTGPLALLPTRSGFSNVVWSTTPSHARALEAMTASEFGEAVTHALHSAAPEFPKFLDVPDFIKFAGPARALKNLNIPEFLGAADPRKMFDTNGLMGAAANTETPPIVTGWEGRAPQSFPLSVQHAGRYVSPRLALVGDAAHVVHPLAGQGVNLGFGDAEALVDTLSHAVQNGFDIGDLSILQNSYERQRMAINGGMTAALHAIYSIFRVPEGPFAHARSAGLAVVNATPPLRAQFMRVAMGDVQLPSQLPKPDFL